MSRTFRAVDGELRPSGIVGRNITRHKPGGHKSVGKWAVGPGGINCPCCTKMAPNKMKVKVRRWERHTFRMEDYED